MTAIPWLLKMKKNCEENKWRGMLENLVMVYQTKITLTYEQFIKQMVEERERDSSEWTAAKETHKGNNKFYQKFSKEKATVIHCLMTISNLVCFPFEGMKIVILKV